MEIRDELENWIDEAVIADAIVEAMEDAGLEPTLENGKRVWYSFLESELHDGLSATASRAFGGAGVRRKSNEQSKNLVW